MTGTNLSLSFRKREFSPVYLALILVLGCVTFRMRNGNFPEFILLGLRLP